MGNAHPLCLPPLGLRGLPLRQQCLTAKAQRRDIYRWVHEDVIDRHKARTADADGLMRRRGALAEHPFGTLKGPAAYHFTVIGTLHLHYDGSS